MFRKLCRKYRPFARVEDPWPRGDDAAPVLVGAALSFLVLRGRPERWQLTALVGTAGIFAVAAFEDMIAEAHETEDTDASTAALLIGFALFTFVSTTLG